MHGCMDAWVHGWMDGLLMPYPMQILIIMYTRIFHDTESTTCWIIRLYAYIQMVICLPLCLCACLYKDTRMRTSF